MSGPKFKVGDRVIILIDTNFQKANHRTIVTGVELSPDTFDNDSYIYRLDAIPNRNYLYDQYLNDQYLILDVEYYRDQKLNKLGI